MPDLFLVLLVPVVCALTATRLDVRLSSGASWDTYAFLDNAADMAGRSVGYVEPHRPPMLPFLTSLLLRLGYWDVGAIQVLDGALTVVGIIGFYVLMRRRFERPLALLASILLLLVTPLWSWLGAGYTDFPSVALSIWAVVLAVKATEDDSRWYWLVFPMLLFAILMRFGAFIMIIPVVLWIVLRSKPFRQARDITIGLALAAASYVPAASYFYRYFGDPFFPFGFATRVAEVGLAASSRSVRATSLLSQVPGWYFVHNGTRLLFQGNGAAVSAVIIGAGVAGLLVAAIATLIRQRPLWRFILPLAAVGLVALAEWRGGSIARLGSITLLGFVIGHYVTPVRWADDALMAGKGVVHYFRRLGPEGAIALDAVVLVWGLLFLDAHGHMQPQIDRYFITMAPAALYFLTLGWRTLGVPLARLSGAIAGRLWKRPGISPRLASIFAIAALSLAVALGVSATLARYSPTARRARDPIVLGAEKTAQWLTVHDPGIAGKTVYSDVWPLTSWYLGFEAYPMPTFESGKAAPHELAKNRVDYYVTIRGRRYGGYRTAYGAGSATVLKYVSTYPRALPAVLYFGDGWDAYAEELCNFDYNLFFTSRRQMGAGTWMLDALPARELAKYDAIAIFGTHWRNKGDAENALRNYVRNGGVAIIDASRNMDNFSYPLVDTVFLDTLVRRKKLAPSAEMSVTPELAEMSRIPERYMASPFVGEKGGPWFTATYAPADWTGETVRANRPLRVLASAGTEPVVVVQTMGRGKIYWLGANLMWHAFLEGNSNDVRLVRGVLRDALGLPPIPAAEVASTAKPWFISKKLRPVRKPVAPAATARAPVLSASTTAVPPQVR